MAAPTEQTAVEQSQPGASDVAGWMDRYGPALRRHFAKRGAAQDADDLVQEVFLRLQASAGRTSIDNVERYLFRIANNVLVSRHRHRAVRDRAGHDLPPEVLDWIDDLSPERVMMGRQAMAQFVVGLRTMAPRAREAFLFHRFEEMTYPAIARQMGISVSAVEKLIIRALEHLSGAVELEA
ncbi:MAG TPA: RNA polymerase sigma factor [Caulobacteraceae bacterium]